MKTLYLIRHAKSSWDFPELDDIDRPLNKRGKRDAPDMGQRLGARGIFPDLMLSSPANRALTTAKKIARELGYPEGEIEMKAEVYHASSNKLLSVVQRIDDTWQTAMLFGHNPGFTDFVNLIANENIANIPTCGVFGCQFSVDRWADINFGHGQKVFFDYPKNNV